MAPNYCGYNAPPNVLRKVRRRGHHLLQEQCCLVLLDGQKLGHVFLAAEKLMEISSVLAEAVRRLLKDKCVPPPHCHHQISVLCKLSMYTDSLSSPAIGMVGLAEYLALFLSSMSITNLLSDTSIIF